MIIKEYSNIKSVIIEEIKNLIVNSKIKGDAYYE